MATIEDRFNAAVNVIKGLPKNGSYQPSSAMMLTFYAYFKQATEGPCKQKKPNFWDIIKKAKWDAWNALGDMSRERAMQLYVDELKKIIETMSYTENVANFMGSIGELDNISFDDLEAIAPEIIKMARSHPDSPFASRGGSPQHPSAQHLNGFINGDTSSPEPNYTHQNGHTVDQSDDEYIDTVEDDPDIPLYKNQKLSHLNRSDINLDLTRENLTPAPQQILGIMERMNADISAINQRILTLERHVIEIKNMQVIRKSNRKYPPWWPFEEISPMWFTFLILWPFLARRLGQILRRKN